MFYVTYTYGFIIKNLERILYPDEVTVFSQYVYQGINHYLDMEDLACGMHGLSVKSSSQEDILYSVCFDNYEIVFGNNMISIILIFDDIKPIDKIDYALHQISLSLAASLHDYLLRKPYNGIIILLNKEYLNVNIHERSSDE